MSNVPSSNLLKRALRVIKPSSVNYFRFNGRALNDVGQYIATYDPPIVVKASVQAVNRDTYNDLGLDFQKRYVKFLMSVDVIDLARDVSGDKIEFMGKTFQLESSTPWHAIDGWVRVIGVQLD